MSADNPKPCDHTSVGAIIRNEAGEFLTFTRATPPAGIAGPAGHIDDHGGPEAAIIAEVGEEVGLTAVGQRLLLYCAYRPNACRRPGGLVGHDWWLWEVETQGTLDPSVRETRDVRWRTPAELQELAARTLDHVRGRISAEEFAERPGIEPVWIAWFARAGALTTTVDDEWAISQFMRRARTAEIQQGRTS